MIEKILVADDDPLMLRFIVETLRRRGKEITIAKDGKEAIRLIELEPYDLLLCDVRMPLKSGLDVMLAMKKGHPHSLSILMTANGCIEEAVEAIRLGAFNYLLKPFSPDALETAIQKAEEHLRLVKENRFLKEEKNSRLVAESPEMQRIVQDLEKIARSNASVFITGESGTGKEVLAAEIHRLSNRSAAPFIKVNCAAIPETLVESEFFGHERGAFTGAIAKKTGRFELADKGTLFLDEVTEIPIVLQPKLLRAIQEQEFERVGGMKPIKVNVRFLAASNRSMQEAIETKMLREDLYYRLNVMPIHIPPLRARTEDILPLARHFLEKTCAENHKTPKTFSEKAIQKLLKYSWPGNVRELANIIERTVVLDFDPVIDAEHLYLEREEKPPENYLGMTLHELEKRLILNTLEANHQNKTKTASVLGISVRTLRNKLHEYGLAQEEA
jgi:two-component system, NtrC family, response regulator AtoC